MACFFLGHGVVAYDTYLTRVDYCNAVLADLPNSALAPLQRVLHAAARFVADIGPRDHITPTLLLVRERSALADPYCHSAWMSVGLCVCPQI